MVLIMLHAVLPMSMARDSAIVVKVVSSVYLLNALLMDRILLFLATVSRHVILFMLVILQQAFVRRW